MQKSFVEPAAIERNYFEFLNIAKSAGSFDPDFFSYVTNSGNLKLYLSWADEPNNLDWHVVKTIFDRKFSDVITGKILTLSENYSLSKVILSTRNPFLNITMGLGDNREDSVLTYNSPKHIKYIDVALKVLMNESNYSKVVRDKEKWEEFPTAEDNLDLASFYGIAQKLGYCGGIKELYESVRGDSPRRVYSDEDIKITIEEYEILGSENLIKADVLKPRKPFSLEALNELIENLDRENAEIREGHIELIDERDGSVLEVITGEALRSEFVIPKANNLSKTGILARGPFVSEMVSLVYRIYE